VINKDTGGVGGVQLSVRDQFLNQISVFTSALWSWRLNDQTLKSWEFASQNAMVDYCQMVIYIYYFSC